jgi:hypothetical protein
LVFRGTFIRGTLVRGTFVRGKNVVPFIYLFGQSFDDERNIEVEKSDDDRHKERNLWPMLKF